MEPSVEYVVAVLYVLRCGEAFMPLDPSWPEERILKAVSSSRADLILGCESLVDDGYFHKLDKDQQGSPNVFVAPKQVSQCFVLFTAPCYGLLNRFLWMQFAFTVRRRTSAFPDIHKLH
ncbi:hypothetical protein ACH5RR_023652 [Cinchona calisaya]|uniref:AMP-dependent synthetase/ligase domain-containing protein n=1 Tax=Cinchona calisaya TaxID=153742 RepID=A0ABD2ZEQ3_9GENT